MAKTHKLPQRKRLPLASLIDNPRNTQVHPLSQINMIAESVKTHGQVGPIVARAANMMLISGHGVAAGMRLAGETEADVYLWDVDQQTADRFMVAANQLAKLSRTDDERLRELLEGVPSEDLAALGFKQDEVEKLRAQDDPDLFIKEIETDDVRDRCWVVITASLEYQAAILKHMQQLEGVGDIQVELGTTPM